MDPNIIRKKAETKLGRSLTTSEAKMLNEAVIRYAKIKAVEAGDLSTEELAKTDPLAYNMAKKKGLTGKTSKADVDLQRQLRTALKNELKDIGFQKMASAVKKIRTTEETNKGDVSLMYQYVKLLDPDSVVREGEIALIDQAPAPMQKILREYNKVVNGRLFSPQERQNIREQAESMYISSLEQAKESIDAYKEDAQAYGLDPDRVLGSYKNIEKEYEESIKKAETKKIEPQPPQQQSAVPTIDAQGNITINPKQIKQAAVDALPLAGGVTGSLLGSFGGPVGTVAGAGIGSALGKSAESAIEGATPRSIAQGLYGLTPAGMFINKLSPQDQVTKDIQNEAGTSMAFSLGGELLGQGLKAGGNLLTKVLPKKIFGGVFKEGMKQTKAGIQTGASLADEALEKGVKGSADDIYINAVKRVAELEDEIQKMLKNSREAISVKEFQKYVNPLIGELKKAGSTSADDIISRIQRITANNQSEIPLKVANQIKRTLYDEARKSYGSQASASIEGVKALAKGIKEKIAEKVPEISRLNKDIGFYGRVADSMLDKLSRTGRNNLISLGDLMAGAVTGNPITPFLTRALSTTGAQTNIGQALNSLGSFARNIPTRISQGIQSVASQTVPRPFIDEFNREKDLPK